MTEPRVTLRGMIQSVRSEHAAYAAAGIARPSAQLLCDLWLTILGASGSPGALRKVASRLERLPRGDADRQAIARIRAHADKLEGRRR